MAPRVPSKIILLVGLCIYSHTISAQHIDSRKVINEDGSLNEKYTFVNGKYFLKDEYKGEVQASTFPAKYFTQCVDHFSDPPCQTTFQQRYWVRKDFYQPGGPIFFYLGAEGNEEGTIDDGEWLYQGSYVNALFVVMEHRDYGESYITDNQDASSLRVLTSEQALADYANFITWFKQSEGLTNAKVLCVGGSYGGNLAAWAKEKYPNVFNVAWSSSGPLNATFNMVEYVQTVSEVIYWINENCYYALQDIFQCIQDIAAGYNGCSTSTPNRNSLPQNVNYCYGVNWADSMSPQYFYKAIAMLWMGNWPARQNTPMCNSLLNRYNQSNGDPIAGYKAFLNDNGISWGCSGEPLGAASDMTSWIWQTCNEFGYYQSSDPKYQLFGAYTWGPDVWASGCRETWGEDFTDEYIESRVAQTNNYYHGHDNTGCCIIFVNGGYDPWHLLGNYMQSQTDTNNNTVVFIPTGEHCDDLTHAKTKAVTNAQATIRQTISQYLSSTEC